MTALLFSRGTAAPAVGASGPAIVQAARSRRHRRTAIVIVGLLIFLTVMFGLAMIVGDFPITIKQVWLSLTGRGTRATDFIVYELRLPRAVTGLAVGVCFGLSGAIFQSMMRNPLASPDIIGITSGASAAAVIAILMLHLNGFVVSAFAFVGALVTALLIYLLAWKQGVAGYRLVLVGIGIAAMLEAIIDYLMTRAQIWDAQAALLWLTGSLNGASADGMAPLLILMAVTVPLALWAGRALGGLQLGDDAATSVGVRVERSRLFLILIGVALAAIATAAAGPVAFVAFVSGPIARRLTNGTGIALVPAALVGAAVVISGDFAGQHLLPVQLPVGILTAAVGAPYLLYLLVRSNRIGHGG
ncbi:iron-siderophore ABC transporter permease protein [Microlunatus phosphovorus NM-1]|uniref:Iron-siderophore ABC transporter permease protein n=1 Tax=Microlunatus phosphovorus (strain ATCC 700054 / DSM 10555 / JCM 9379 / NBRC 101784 / NCIMB 13414 / VKM Ac-1990 / NM-1) TaxID=1032480 RepID=F5XG52_MICPN|nr:iron chelate uptake ABC transporter family permease subunit [Microlunatus phosphovorus]BAK37986.1 iron-siderophore ABC transporter permease protein [Microlunatus phosphovorus NM-1]